MNMAYQHLVSDSKEAQTNAHSNIQSQAVFGLQSNSFNTSELHNFVTTNINRRAGKRTNYQRTANLSQNPSQLHPVQTMKQQSVQQIQLQKPDFKIKQSAGGLRPKKLQVLFQNPKNTYYGTSGGQGFIQNQLQTQQFLHQSINIQGKRSNEDNVNANLVGSIYQVQQPKSFSNVVNNSKQSTPSEQMTSYFNQFTKLSRTTQSNRVKQRKMVHHCSYTEDAQGPPQLISPRSSEPRSIDHSLANQSTPFNPLITQQTSQNHVQQVSMQGQDGTSQQFHIINQTGINLNSILQSQQLQNILQSQASQNKQQIIIVQSGGAATQALQQILQNTVGVEQAVGSGQAVSLSGLSIGQLKSILEQMNIQNFKTDQISNQQQIQNILGHSNHFETAQTQQHFRMMQEEAPTIPFRNTTTTTIDQSGIPRSSDLLNLGNQRRLPAVDAHSHFQSLQQQINHLQMQTQLIQQQILNNVLQQQQLSHYKDGSQSSESPIFKPYHPKDFNQQMHQQLQQIQSLQSQISQLQIMQSQVQNQSLLKSLSGINPSISTTHQFPTTQQQFSQFLSNNYQLNLGQYYRNNKNEGAQSVQQVRSNTFDKRKGQSRQQDHFMSSLNQETNARSGQKQTSKEHSIQKQLFKQLSQLNMDKSESNETKQQMEEQLDIIRVRHNSIKKKKEAIQQIKTQEPKDLKQKLCPNTKLKGISRNSIIKDAINNQTDVKTPLKSKTIKQSKIAKTSELTSSGVEMQTDPVKKNRIIIPKHDAIEQFESVLQRREPMTTTKLKIGDDITAELLGEEDQSAIMMKQGSKMNLHPLSQLHDNTLGFQKDIQNGFLRLPSPKPNLLRQESSISTMSKKEKRRLQQEAERKREKELFEKNFKPSSLQINIMGLNNQKSFIKNQANTVYHKHRMVTIDTTQTHFQRSAVPTLGDEQRPLITQDELVDFYIQTVTEFHLAGRKLEVVEEPPILFKEEQASVDPKKHSIQERKIYESLKEMLKEKNEKVKPERLLESPIVIPASDIKESTLFFNSRFESGNLYEVEKVSEYEYNCFVSFDFNSSVHSQWYYFSVRNIGVGGQFKFNICNLQKDESNYQIGMKPFVYSLKKNRKNGTNVWQRGCENVCYYKNKLFTRARECAPDYEYDESNIPCYEYEDEQSKLVSLNTLSFCYEFEFEHDTVFFAYFQPYTTSDLEDFLFSLNKSYDAAYLSNIYKAEKLCQTINGNPIYALTITENVHEDDCIRFDGTGVTTKRNEKFEMESQRDGGSSNRGLSSRMRKNENNREALKDNFVGDRAEGAHSSLQMQVVKSKEMDQADDGPTVLSGFQMDSKMQREIDPNQKQTIFLTARVHPGESNSSFMIQGAIEYLLQPNNKEAKQLRETFIFKIIPMLNPDGVANGNYRCSLIGADLNRRWLNPSKLLHPEIYFAKKLLKMCHQDNQVLLFCDFHGHTRKRNAFMYGCQIGQSEIDQHKKNNLIRVLPYLLEQRNKIFNFADCKFANERDKESTGRMVMFKEFGILNSYTLEATFYSSYNQKQGKKMVNVPPDEQIKTEDLSNIGSDFVETLLIMVNSKILKRKFMVETAMLGNSQPGVGGNPMTQFFLNQKEGNKSNMLKSHMVNSQQYQNENNIQSTLSKLINGPAQQAVPTMGLGQQYQSQNGRNTSSPDKIRRMKKLEVTTIMKQMKQL